MEKVGQGNRAIKLFEFYVQLSKEYNIQISFNLKKQYLKTLSTFYVKCDTCQNLCSRGQDTPNFNPDSCSSNNVGSYNSHHAT